MLSYARTTAKRLPASRPLQVSRGVAGDCWRERSGVAAVAGARGCSDALTLRRALSLSGSLSHSLTAAGVAAAAGQKKQKK